MKFAVAFAFAALSTFAVASHGVVHQHRRQSCTTANMGSNPGQPNTDGYYQVATGEATFTEYSGCGSASCGGKISSGFTVAMNQRAFGASSSFGDACGRCFKITGNKDPYSPSYTGPFNSIVVKVNDLCPSQGNGAWCGQTESNPTNQFGAPVHFDLCQDSGAAAAFFPSGRGALSGTYTEVSCTEWTGGCPTPLWNNWCMGNNTTPLWPGKGCGNAANS